jgi:ATP-dependent helicase/nuclease subunit B
MAETAFAGLDAIGERRDIWLRRFARAAHLFLMFERDRDAEIAVRKAEIDGDWTLPGLDGFRLAGRADRVDVRHDGRLELIDFKTGSVPKPGDMKDFDAPQLLLEAAMARAGGFAGISPAPSEALTYIKIGLGPDAFIVQPFTPADGFDLGSAAAEAVTRTERHVRSLLLSDELPMAAAVRPDPNRRYRGEFEHLARTDEWTLNEGDDSE